ncbi:hypothetical protein ACPOL_6978 (plasmid) [Acidisarcina polymorpha]|uniref:Uncharacterized protein n=2 Tax=Acidisarcina polymorpha TaxID=2211140 RepID=A0A2Z5GAA6_9BACT|nr:hypothetical protein ACPOL_6978 [Acidisarcina polymorpha]
MSAMVQTTLKQDPFSGHVFVFAEGAVTWSRRYGQIKSSAETIGVKQRERQAARTMLANHP